MTEAPSLPLHCPYCNWYCGEFVSIVQMHIWLFHSTEPVPEPSDILDHSAMLAEAYRLRHVVGSLVALAPDGEAEIDET